MKARYLHINYVPAELLAEAIDCGLRGRRPLNAALEEYERKRKEAAFPLYEFTCQLATLAPHHQPKCSDLCLPKTPSDLLTWGAPGSIPVVTMLHALFS